MILITLYPIGPPIVKYFLFLYSFEPAACCTSGAANMKLADLDKIAGEAAIRRVELHPIALMEMGPHFFP
jgi:hypothetical protein